MKRAVGLGLAGLWLGATLALVGFSSPDEVKRMLRLLDLRLVFTFGGAVALAALAFVLLGARAQSGSRPITKRTVIGALIFGVGWGITGVCPGSVFVQLASFAGPAVLSLVAIASGILLADWAERRFRLPRDECGVD